MFFHFIFYQRVQLLMLDEGASRNLTVYSFVGKNSIIFKDHHLKTIYLHSIYSQQIRYDMNFS